MPGDIRLGLRLRADARGFVGEVRVARRELDRLRTTADGSTAASERQGSASRRASAGMNMAGRAARQTAAANRQVAESTRRAGGSFFEAHGRILNYAAAVGAVSAALRQLRRVDAYTELNNRLRLLTNSERDLIAVREQLFEVSRRTRSDLTANAQAYSRIVLATDNLELSQTQALRVLELLNQQVAIGGSNAGEAAAGLVQFAQGLASGRLQGDELRSVMENLIGVQQGLLIGFRELRRRGTIDFEVTRANIRQLASEGILSSDLLVQAILASADDTDAKFRQVAVSIAGALTNLNNSITALTGEAFAASGVTEDLIGILEGLTGLLGPQNRELADDMADITRAATYLAGVLAARLTLAISAYAAQAVRASAANVQWGASAFAASRRAVQLRRALDLSAVSARRAAQAMYTVSAAANLLRGALAFLGGPGGVALLAAYALLEFATSSRRSRDDVDELIPSVREFREELALLSQEQLNLRRIELQEQFQEAHAALDAARAELDNLNLELELRSSSNLSLGGAAAITQLRGRIAELTGEVERLRGVANRAQGALLELGDAQRRLTSDPSLLDEQNADQGRAGVDREREFEAIRRRSLSAEERRSEMYRANLQVLAEEEDSLERQLQTIEAQSQARLGQLRQAGVPLAQIPVSSGAVDGDTADAVRARLAEVQQVRRRVRDKYARENAAAAQQAEEQAERRRAQFWQQTGVPGLIGRLRQSGESTAAGLMANHARERALLFAHRAEIIARGEDFQAIVEQHEAEHQQTLTRLQAEELRKRQNQEREAYEAQRRQREIANAQDLAEALGLDLDPGVIEIDPGRVQEKQEEQIAQRQGFQSRVEAQAQAHRERLLAIDLQYDQAQLQRQLQFQNFLRQLNRGTVEGNIAAAQAGLELVKNTARDFAGQSKAAFRVYQASAIAQTIISTYQGAQNAYEKALATYPPPFGQALAVAGAAVAIAAGFARVQAIRSQRPPQGFARGGVVEEATFFSARGVPRGVAGEAGAEAILPLRRLRDGTLGVGAQGGGRAVVVRVSIGDINVTGAGAPGETAAAIEQALQRRLPALIRGTLAEEQRPGGLLNRSGQVGR